jgi:hypothetical protein
VHLVHAIHFPRPVLSLLLVQSGITVVSLHALRSMWSGFLARSDSLGDGGSLPSDGSFSSSGYLVSHDSLSIYGALI